MIIYSALSPKEYLSAMKNNMSGHLELGQERFTGFFLGRLFYVTYHSGYEWNRRITNQKNAAMGYVKRTENGCEVRAIRFRGALCPLIFFPALAIILAFCIFTREFYSESDNLFRLIMGVVLTVVSALIGTLIECMTERSEDGLKTLLSMMLDPTDPLVNYDKV